MITLGIIVYITISLILSWDFTRDKYSLEDGRQEGMNKQRALKYGFLFIPMIVVGMALFLCAFMAFAYIVVGILVVCGWIATNMP